MSSQLLLEALDAPPDSTQGVCDVCTWFLIVRMHSNTPIYEGIVLIVLLCTCCLAPTGACRQLLGSIAHPALQTLHLLLPGAAATVSGCVSAQAEAADSGGGTEQQKAVLAQPCQARAHRQTRQ